MESATLLHYTTKEIAAMRNEEEPQETIHIDIIVPAYNASKTIEATIQSALQAIAISPPHFHTVICCYNDGSTDDTRDILIRMQQKHHQLLIVQHGTLSHGAGYARNQAAAMRPLQHKDRHFLCLLDSDDIMHPQRLTQQVQNYMMNHLSTPLMRHATIVGCQFHREPSDSTHAYTKWANELSDERILLERYREVTILQPTWVMTKYRFQQLGGYITSMGNDDDDNENIDDNDDATITTTTITPPCIHPTFDTPDTIRLAEDLRFMYAHLYDNHGTLALVRQDLLMYRHTGNTSQSSQTSRKLLFHVRAFAMERAVLAKTWKDQPHFVIWGAGRDGKDFLKALSPQMRNKVYCFVDIDTKKLGTYYVNKDIDVKIPIVHYSYLIKDPIERKRIIDMDYEPHFGNIQKGKQESTTTSSCQPPPTKRRKTVPIVDVTLLPDLPVVVCVAMYRTNGALEANVASIGRTEGDDLWHFC